MTEGYDVAIIGGAVMGSAVASFLSTNADFDGRIVVVERDQSYAYAATARSTSGFRQQFSTAANIKLSRWSADFLAHADELLAVDGVIPGIGITESGYLYLGGPDNVAGFEANHALQRALGVDVALLDPRELKRRFPWLNTGDLAIGSLGLSGEGWFDGYLLMRAFMAKARANRVDYLFDPVTGLTYDEHYQLQLSSGAQLTASRLVLTAGAWTPGLSAQLELEIPVRPVKQSVFRVESPFNAPDMPFVFTPDGLFCRPEGGEYLAGIGIRDDADEAALDDFEADHSLFEAEIWPRMAHRIRAFEEARFRGAWAGHYDLSDFDHNPFVGAIDTHPGLYIATGFSGHGIMQAPGIGLALSELITYGQYKTLDLSDLSYARIAAGRPVREGIQY